MSKDIYDVMINPTRMRIVQILASLEKKTATELCEIISDVPRTTLYRHINILIDAHVLTVVEERKVRGSVERTLSLNTDELSKQNTMEDVPKKMFTFLMNIYTKFDKYFNRVKFKPGNNKIFFNNTILMMDDREFDQFLLELQGLLIKHSHEMSEGRRPRDISIISAPPKKVRNRNA
ncbi:helix-turn-helix domain-containing protein [Paenibacillus sp. DMB5]|uniref:helix-turn-helix domain-containing protein n=1 Tax=Paenibacillus sp. DMB5 TaxID=1780103 RepID=UPI00076CD11C|nr:helix-turn-helix domain-containing protein [Paenibacillus sp. DMB5]KUP23216.1 hypothetical protein AWJ19_21825 [Paenibacillus sp. DMB5]